MDNNQRRRARELLAEVLERPEAERDAQLRKRCTDPDLLRELKTLLADAATLTQLLEPATHTILTTALVPDTLTDLGGACFKHGRVQLASLPTT